eukprot:GSChrysophyteH2.ASY1.ANO1.1322.1 assembled CDS
MRSSCASFSTQTDIFEQCDTFIHRHMGSQGSDRQVMLEKIGFKNMPDLVSSTVPTHIRNREYLALDEPLSESEALQKLKGIMSKNQVKKSFIGLGYYETMLPNVILRNVLESPGWYTAYTPYQAEIAQGRLSALLNFQTMVADLTGMAMSNASLLDEATAAAEAMSMCYSLKNGKRNKYFVDKRIHPQNIGLVHTRAAPLGIEVVVGNAENVDFSCGEWCGALAQYPDTYGHVQDWTAFNERAHEHGVLTCASTDLMASTLLKPAGEMGFDMCVGSAQRFGVPMGFGGPHAAFLATTPEYSRKMPGRIIGVSIDSRGKPALRMAMQTREQHIRRDKATSNICTAQALLANIAGFYGVYHGPEGLKRIARRIHGMTAATAEALTGAGYKLKHTEFFDTLCIDVSSKGKTSADLAAAASAAGANIRIIDETHVGISFGETISKEDTMNLLSVFGITDEPNVNPESSFGNLNRESDFMTHPNFNSHHSETQMLRYLKSLEKKDLSLDHSMIALGSCTMKLNATTEMLPVTWNEVGNMHPFAPVDQTTGYLEMVASLHKDLAEITGFAACSTQPNSGAQGELAGLNAIRQYHIANGDEHRNICLIPTSAHGTNPASAAMTGMKVVVIKSDKNGNVDMEDFKAKAEKHSANLAALMITYPSTYGVYEEGVKEIVDIVHSHGGQIYMDGANMNAQVGFTSPGYIGADVCHLNLHKTFCIPHGGGGPGVGTIGVAKHLAPHLPGHSVTGAVSAAPYGSASILPVTWLYIKMLGRVGLEEATGMAILNANYLAECLKEDYNVLYTGKNGQCAHEFIIDLRPFKVHGIVEEDVAKRLQDYGFHSPTMSWPVAGTLMIEPTESEDKAELDRFVFAMKSIRQEIDNIVDGKLTPEESPLKLAPHTQDMVTADIWDRKYSRETAAFPAPWVLANKFWPTVGRLDNVYGDRNLVCSCPPMSVYED